mgnify:CR=1 FL=1
MSATAEMARREELLPIPFAKLMAVFQDPNLNVEWNPNLIKQSFLTLGGLAGGEATSGSLLDIVNTSRCEVSSKEFYLLELFQESRIY